MKLLLDANLSFRLIDLLRELYPDVIHVKDIGLDSAGDEVIWSYALNNGYTVVSKDSDFRHLSFVHGAPPKVISIKRGQLSTQDCFGLLQRSHERIVSFLNDEKECFLVLD